MKVFKLNFAICKLTLLTTILPSQSCQLKKRDQTAQILYNAQSQ
ncbi:hypothetical protein BGP_5412 [Beggiatoa sp. PS]|nr:hypothetical protein BGP_5412 [Beggiatoa sp. PS]